MGIMVFNHMPDDQDIEMLKDTLLFEIESLPDSCLQTVLDFVLFLKYLEQKNQTGDESRPRIPGLDTGSTWVSEDFDEPLPDSFWLGMV